VLQRKIFQARQVVLKTKLHLKAYTTAYIAGLAFILAPTLGSLAVILFPKFMAFLFLWVVFGLFFLLGGLAVIVFLRYRDK